MENDAEFYSTLRGKKRIETAKPGPYCCEIVSKTQDADSYTLQCCNEPLYQPAVDVGLMGSGVNCETHLREYFSQWGETLEQAIEKKSGNHMSGQLWEPCFCGTEPVCSACMNCQDHCTCGKPKEKSIIPPFEPYRKGIGQGFGSTEDGD